MAKVPFTKLKCKVNDSIKQVELGDGVVIEIKQYLPIQEKLSLIGRVAEQAHTQDYNFSNPVKAAVIRDIEIVFAYTNLGFTEKQKEDIPKLYDILHSSGILTTILSNIPEHEYVTIVNGVKDTIEAFYQYVNSVVGVLDSISANQKDTLQDMDALQQGIEALRQSPILKDIAPLIGLE